MPRRTAFDAAKKIYKSSPLSKEHREEFERWKLKWRKAGPIKFAEKVLEIDPSTGFPLTLSDDQKEFLTDLWLGNIKLAIISAGRGAGKTFVLAVYITWRIWTHNYWNISSMGGSQEQSDKIQFFIRGWRRYNPVLQKYIEKDVMGEVRTKANSGAIFMACSATSVRGPHTRELIIDEVCAGEERGGTKFIKAAIWQVSTSRDLHIILSSTAHWVHGIFLERWTNAKRLGYKRYRWAIAKHISGSKDIYTNCEDTNPKHWVSNVPWVPDKNIGILRGEKSNDEWLVEALGGISVSAGLVFSPKDLDKCICDRCPKLLNKPCKPYLEDYCPIVQMFLELGGMPKKKIPNSTTKALMFIGQRVEGVDWGKSAPCAYIVLGKYKQFIFVLDAIELTGLSDQAKIDTAAEMAKKWNVSIIRPDPREWAYNNALLNQGFAVHELFTFEGGKEKSTYVYAAKKNIERLTVIIPARFEALIRSLKNLTFDEKGRVRKVDDHSFEAFSYGISLYEEQAQLGSIWLGGGMDIENQKIEGDKPPHDKYCACDKCCLWRKKHKAGVGKLW